MSVALYDDRLEIISIGDLHFGLTPEVLFREHESKPWNPMIARTLYRRGIIETWGRGTLTPEKTLGKTQLAILELLRGAPHMTTAELASRLDRSGSAINRAIRQLRESGRLQRIGPDKGGSWKVLD